MINRKFAGNLIAVLARHGASPLGSLRHVSFGYRRRRGTSVSDHWRGIVQVSSTRIPKAVTANPTYHRDGRFVQFALTALAGLALATAFFALSATSASATPGVPPTISITTPDDSGGAPVFASTSVATEWTVGGSENVLTTVCYLDSVPLLESCNGLTAFQLQDLTDGVRDFTVEVTDDEGDSTNDTVLFEVDNAPRIEASRDVFTSYSAQPTIAFDVLDPDLDPTSVMCSIDGQTPNRCQRGQFTTHKWWPSSPLGEGTYVLTVTADDVAGGNGPQSASHDITINVQSPPGGGMTIDVVPSTTRAGRHPDLLVDVVNDSGEDPESINVSLPDGFAGSLNAVSAKCEYPPPVLLDDQTTHSSTDVETWCDETTRDQAKLGEVLVEGVVDNSTARMKGSVYMTERRVDGEVAGIAIDIPAKVDGLDLGHVVVAGRLETRSRGVRDCAEEPEGSGIFVCPEDGGVTPVGVDTLIDDMPNQITSVHGTSSFTMKRTRMWLRSQASGVEPTLTNASDCTPDVPLATTAQIETHDGAVYDAADPYEVTDCGDQPFSPSMTMNFDSTAAGTLTGATTSLTLPAGSTSIESVVIDLPRSIRQNLSGDLGNGIPAAFEYQCSLEDVQKDPPNCNDDTTRGGTFTVTSPLLENDITGSVYYVDSKGAIPYFYLYAYDEAIGAKIRLVGRAVSPTSQAVPGIRLEFAWDPNSAAPAVSPDFPISSMTLDLPGPSYPGSPVPPLEVVGPTYCLQDDFLGVRFKGHTGRVATQVTPVSFTGCDEPRVAISPAISNPFTGGSASGMGGTTSDATPSFEVNYTPPSAPSAPYPRWKCAIDSPSDYPGDAATPSYHAFRPATFSIPNLPCSGTNEQHRLFRSGNVSGGTFKLTYSGQQTAAIAFDADEAAVTSALEALSNIGVGDVSVTFTGATEFRSATQVVIEYKGALAQTDVPQITIQSSLTGGGSFSVSTLGGPLSFTFTPPSSLGDGVHMLVIQVEQASGSTYFDFVVFTVDSPGDDALGAPEDTTPPTTSITSSALGTTAGQQPTIDFDSGEAGTDFACRLTRTVGMATLDEAFQPCGSNSQTGSFTPATPLDPGSYTFEVRAEDGVGNADTTPAEETFTVDPPFGPTFTATPSTSVARAHPTLDVTIESKSDEDLKLLEFSMPQGFVGSLLGAQTRCSAADAAAAVAGTGSCPSTSKVGTVTGTAQADFSEVVQQGDAFLTEPLQAGDPAGLVVSIPAQVGAIDMGTITVRNRLVVRGNLDGVDSVSLDEVPHSIVDDKDTDGFTSATVNFHLRKVELHLAGGAGATQPLLTNPSSCAPTEFKGTFTSYDHTVTNAPDVPFQATNCDALPFYTAFTAGIEQLDSSFAPTGKVPTAGDTVRFSGTIAASPDDAGVKAARLELPRALTATATGLPIGCSVAIYEATKTCDKGDSAVIGHVIATTPLLPTPIEGKVYLGQPKLGSFIEPGYDETLRIIVQLRGLVAVDLVGRSTLKDYRSVTVFENIPDSPVESFTVTVDKIVRVRPTACDADLQYRTITGFNLAHNGKTSDYNSDVNINCEGKIQWSASLGGKGKKAKSTVTGKATGGAKIRSATVTLPKGLTPIKTKFKKKVQVIADGRKVRGCAKLKGRTVTVTLCGKTATKMELRFGPGSLNMPKKIKKAKFVAVGTLSNGRTVSSTIQLSGKSLKKVTVTGNN